MQTYGKTAISSVMGLAMLAGLMTASAAELTGRVVGVSDGDTITVMDQGRQSYKVRLAGIDAPEKRQAFGQRSKQSLSDAVFDRDVTVEWSKRDKYGRVVGKVLLTDGTDANLRQIELGLAWHYKQYEREQPVAERRAYALAELQARESRAGLWSDPRPMPPWEYRHRMP